MIEVFSRIENFFHRLENYTALTPTAAMKDMIVKIMVEVLTILAVATEEMERGRLSELISLYLSFSTDRLIRKVLEEIGGGKRYGG